MFFPGKRNHHAHTGIGTTIKKPTWWRMVNSHNIQTSLAHERQIGIDLRGLAKIVSFRVRLERSVSDAFNKKLPVTVEKELCNWSNSRVCRTCHVERSRDISQSQCSLGLGVRDSSRASHKATAWQSTSLRMTKEKCCHRKCRIQAMN